MMDQQTALTVIAYVLLGGAILTGIALGACVLVSGWMLAAHAIRRRRARRSGNDTV